MSPPIRTPAGEAPGSTGWRDQLDERERKELQFAELYAGHFKHGTDGHIRMMLMAKMAAFCDQLYLRTLQLEAQLRSEREEGT